MREVKKKVLVIAVALMAVTMLATPLVGTALAGKGQEKLDFLLHLEGLPPMVGAADRAWTAGVTAHVRGGSFEILGDFYIQIGEGGAVDEITKAYLSYEASMDVNQNTKAGFYVLKVRETITIWADTDQTVQRGTLELLSLSDNPALNGATFVGFGTGEFEGVKVSGKSTGWLIGNPNPPYYMLSLDREGTVMGWPT